MSPEAPPPPVAPPAGTLEDTRERLVTAMEIAFAIMMGLACALAAWLLLAVAPETGAGAVNVLAHYIPFAGRFTELAGAGVNRGRVAPFVAFLGGGWLAWKARGLVGWIADHVFPPFDTDLLRPIGKPGALDPLWLPPLGKDQGMQPLSWVAPPRDSPRRAVWAALIAFLSDSVGDGRFNVLGHPRTRFERFRWTVLTGRPGAGKTRIATEIARARAREDLIGRDDETRAERRRLARGAWWRTAWPFAQRREAEVPGIRDDSPWHGADPWDAGWVVAASERGGLRRSQNSRFDDTVLSYLKAWRPRRPTVLVLDDPRPDDASRVVDALLGGERRYRHPVRLIVVSQALPQDLSLKPQLDDSWSAGPRGFTGSVLALGADAPLSAGEVRRMFGALKLSGHVSGWKPTDANVRRLLLRSRGNALLVCLALQQIQRRPTPRLWRPMSCCSTVRSASSRRWRPQALARRTSCALSPGQRSSAVRPAPSSRQRSRLLVTGLASSRTCWTRCRTSGWRGRHRRRRSSSPNRSAMPSCGWSYPSAAAMRLRGGA